MTIITKGMGAILKAAKKRKTLTVDKGALRISEINKKLNFHLDTSFLYVLCLITISSLLICRGELCR